MHTRRAFTLVELLVVISVVSMLASIIMVQISLAQAKGRDSTRTQQVRQIDLATQMYITDFKKAPLADSGCAVITGRTPTWAEASACFAVSTNGVTRWEDFREELNQYMNVPSDPCRGSCEPSNPDFPVGYTYVAPLAMQYFCAHGGNCTADDESYQVYVGFELEDEPTGSEGSGGSNYATSDDGEPGSSGSGGGDTGGEDVTAPPVPSGVNVVKSGNPGREYLTFSWGPITDEEGGSGLGGYTVYLSVNDGPEDVADSQETTFTAGPYLPWGSTACFTVSAYDNAGNDSGRSESACAVIDIPDQQYIVSAPENLTGTYTNNGSTYSVQFSWSPSSSIAQGATIDHYNIYKDGFNVTTSIPTSFQRSNPSWNPGITPYCVTVTAVDSYNNESNMSNEVCLP